MKAHLRFDVRSEDAQHFTLEWEAKPLVRFSDGGESAQLEPTDFSTTDLLRWGAPLALAPLGRVVLHAAAVSTSDRAFVFLGVGGAGKSTLAERLATQGLKQISDDLVVLRDGALVDVGAEAELRRWCQNQSHLGPGDSVCYRDLFDRLEARTDAAQLPLAGLFFVDAERTDEAHFVFDTIEPTAAFQRLVEQGFGGLSIPKAWKSQFEAYAALSAEVRAASLSVPSGLDRMADALGSFIEVLSAW